jgi:hypothetical protein
MTLCMRILMACVVLLGRASAHAARPEGSRDGSRQELALATQESQEGAQGRKTVVKRLTPVVRALTRAWTRCARRCRGPRRSGRDNAIMIARWNDALTTSALARRHRAAYAVVSKTTFAGFGLRLSLSVRDPMDVPVQRQERPLLLTHSPEVPRRAVPMPS